MKRILFTLLILTTFCVSKANPDSAVCKIQPFINEWYKTPYKFGGTSKSGIDCSAFVKNLYKSVFDIDLPRTCKQQIKNITKITQDQLEAGSIIFFKMGQGVWHVGVYLENGLFVHSGSSTGVFISSLDSPYWKRYIYQFGKIIK